MGTVHAFISILRGFFTIVLFVLTGLVFKWNPRPVSWCLFHGDSKHGGSSCLVCGKTETPLKQLVKNKGVEASSFNFKVNFCMVECHLKQNGETRRLYIFYYLSNHNRYEQKRDNKIILLVMQMSKVKYLNVFQWTQVKVTLCILYLLVSGSNTNKDNNQTWEL